MNTFLKKLIPHNIAAIIGILQTIVPLAKEVVIAVIRIIDVLTPDKGLEPVIVKTASVFDNITAGINKFKNMFLGL
jgi:hypothetical protein